MAAPTSENTDVTSASGAEPSVTLMTASASNSAASSSATSGPLLGYDGVAKCTDLQLHSGADWLITALCAISKCNHMWPVSNIDFAGGGDLYDAISADFTTYDLTLASTTTNVKYTDAIGNIADNNGTAWFGGGFDRAIIAMNGPGVDGGKLITNDYSNVTAVETAGMWGLTYLTGQYAVVENIPSNDTTWGKLSNSATWMNKIDGTPVLIRTSDTPDASLKANQYYTLSTMDGTDNVVVWNPSGTGDNSYISIPIGTLKTSSKYLYHLDWAHFFYDVSR
ncbi:hypothetical protein I315_03899 [Cryptococcus gattii Ru294]|uniref:Uncharacterized protein n=2 Tax=Cryptococcus gattii TaxID=37769 RepID=E6QXY2_CRYGW|nr:Hypothetical protein CGB_A5370C [Cryptococcus gattii WM276]KIR53773.1 hypothetical protein I315_03899 [Cryptococcus gattii Ru294]KIR79695.1 hypothetical protein I306_03271 [Cryptococcus gattii EJB2]KIY37102.1 hypothetical protein I305_00195 [Cryptococcus gattii E566]KJE02822.1 hypothetical protein I311_03566 [Cryptococcus gattii NT-10]ADV19740.1 Hypothetical protein CGB_A5370C [Cryptococcus gattii WM276]